MAAIFGEIMRGEIFPHIRMSAMLRAAGKLALAVLLLPYLLVPLYTLLPPVSAVMLGSLLRGDGMARDWVGLTDISPHLIRAVLASEDGRFCDHHGIDFEAIDAAMEKAKRTGRTLHGASTISAQTAKNLFLWNGRSWLRKVLEAPLTLWLDFILSKRRIAEIYLNTAEWGPGVFGAEAAAQAWFRIPAKRLTTRQAALLATTLPSPRRVHPDQPGAYHARRARMIEARMSQAPAIADCVLP